MIFYGTRGKLLRNGQLTNINCPHCEKNVSMKYSVFAKYAHIYWIPFFPYAKLTFLECSDCKATLESRSFSPEMKMKLDREKEKNGKIMFPVWMFSWLIIIGLGVAYSYYSGLEDDKKEDVYIKNPKVGDVYHMRLYNGHYSTARVEGVARDSVKITFNDYETEYSSDIDELNVAKNYTKATYTVSAIRLFSLYKKDTIFTIERYE